MMMVNPANDIVRQAREGSVAAIIQVLNEKLADSGIRTRAIFADGILQLLCEAAQAEQLEQTTTVERIRHILESLTPQNIRKVRINSRIVREQQLLWLEEINRDPENQLLWSQDITLAKPNLLKRLQSASSNKRSRSERTVLPQASMGRSTKKQRQFWQGMVGGIGVSLLLVGVGWALYDGWFAGLRNQIQAKTAESTPDSPSPETSSPESSPATTSTAIVPTSADSFVTAVRIAERASEAGLNAQSSAEWLELAARWQEASDLMKKVASDDKRYKTAQDRAIQYRKNSEAALQQAQARRSS
jgi:hypothetical protein